MTNIIRIKRSATTATPASLLEGEIAYSELSGNLFIGTNGGAQVTKIGGYTDVQKLAGIEAGANAYTHPNHTGDVTSTGDGATVIANGVVSNAKLADMTQALIKGRASGAGTGAPQDLTAAQVKTILAYVGTEIGFTPQGNIGSNNVSDAIVELDNEKLALTGGSLSGALTLSGDPTNPLHAATKQYVDSKAAGIDPKEAVRVATTGSNITLSGTQTIDGVSLSVGDRVLVKDQTTPSQNGIYVVAAGAWSRSTDADTSAEVTQGMYTFVAEGTSNGAKGFILTTPDPIVLDTTGLSFSGFSATPTGAVLKTDYNAHTILAATADDNPVALTVDEDTLVGRLSGGNIAALTATQIRTLINVEDGATADQTDTEIETAYNNRVSVVDQTTAEAGSSSTVYRWTPLRVRQNVEAATIDGGTF